MKSWHHEQKRLAKQQAARARRERQAQALTTSYGRMMARRSKTA